ncbi:MAG: HD domain-containing protein [Spirochaetota bacterium]
MLNNSMEYITLNFDELKANFYEINKNKIPVWRKNKSGSFVIIPAEKIDVFFGSKDANAVFFYIENKWKDRIKKDFNPAQDFKINKKRIFLKEKSEISDPYLAKREEVHSFSMKEREDEYDYILDIMSRIETPNKIIDADNISDLLDLISGAFVINKTSIEENFDTETLEAREHLRKIAERTTSMVKNFMDILSKNKAANNFINLLGEKSTGSTVDHMNGVFITFVSFCFFYNSYFAKGQIARIRSDFKKKHIRLYEKIFPGHPPESLEDVFKGGMRNFDDEEILQYSLGALLHDIGKIDNIDYFEGSEKYDRKIIMKHAPISYNMIVKTREFGSDVALLAGLHHEYYNDKSGYGISHILFPGKNKKYNSPVYAMSYNIDDVKNGSSLAYVPAKILEIVDVFDALTDKNRKYRDREFSVDEALAIMDSEFVQKATKIDPVLFSIFTDYVKNHAILKNKNI